MINYRLLKNRFNGIIYFIALYVVICLITRIVLFVYSFDQAEAGIFNVFSFIVVGLLFDLAASSYVLIPFLVYLILIPDRIFNHAIHRVVAYVLYLVITCAALLTFVSDYLFWDEFQARFNFIAVDYLVYTWEVSGNIWESYPIPMILIILIIIAGAIVYLTYACGWLEKSFTSKSNFLDRLKLGAFGLLVPILFFLSLNQSMADNLFSENRYQQELAKNGLYSLFSAFLNNELDYDKFYLQLDEEIVFEELKKKVKSINSSPIGDDLKNITRKISNTGTEKNYNIMLICVESFSADYMSFYGNKNKITPYLDSLVDSTMFFTNIFATGTRTVRGMEALTLSVPPTPGRSIIKRLNNENLFSPGFIFKERGYDTRFIYGGFGYFDNMNYFFNNNGFDIVDRNDLIEDEITFSNIWGVCDEDLFARSLKEADVSHAANKPFFNYIMTTSNHRPYTYPEGKIDIPSHKGRDGGVKYTDYSINEFLKKAKEKPWFDNTIFVIVSDHCGSSAGKSQLTISKYHIPMFIYAPSIIEPGKVDKLCSQIDVIPTLFGLLNWNYDSKFIGKDIFKMTVDEERALVGNYQKLGLLKRDQLCVLSIKQQNEFYDIDSNYNQTLSYEIDDALLKETVAYYQGQSILYSEKLNMWNNK